MSPRFTVRYWGKREGFLELYVVWDYAAHAEVSAPIAYDLAAKQARERNMLAEASETFIPQAIGWRP